MLKRKKSWKMGGLGKWAINKDSFIHVEETVVLKVVMVNQKLFLRLKFKKCQFFNLIKVGFLL